MAPHRAATRAAALLAALAASLTIAAGSAAAQAPEQKTRRVAIIALPEAAARTVVASHPFGVGLGVFPSARDPARFVLEIGNNAPGVEGELALPNANLAVTLQRSGVLTVTGGMEGRSDITEALVSVFAPRRARTTNPQARAVVEIFQFERAQDAETVFRSRAGVYVVLGFGERTPLLVGLSTDAFRRQATTGILEGGIARRPGIVTPYDIAATLLDQLGIP
ncbi:MAG: hypothetical protein ACRDKS_02240, partial [Actinomycetota bacterium]